METSAPNETISLIFPVYRDEHTVRTVAEKALKVLPDVASEYEVVIVDDASPDRSGEIAEELTRESSFIRVIHHERNRGYGEALRSGFAMARYDWICATDGDDQYDVYDLYKLIRLSQFYDLIITFRHGKPYSSARVFLSLVYNGLVRSLFRTPYRDISTGLRLVRRSLLERVELESSSPFVGAELAIKATLEGYRVGEIAIHSFPREFGRGESVTVPNILATMRDLVRTYRALPANRHASPRKVTRRNLP